MTPARHSPAGRAGVYGAGIDDVRRRAAVLRVLLATMPSAFKEGPAGNVTDAAGGTWKPSQPGDAHFEGPMVVGALQRDHAALNALEEQVAVSNQNVQQAEAQHTRQAKAAVGVSREQLLARTVTTTPSVTIASGRGNTGVDVVTGTSTGTTTGTVTSTTTDTASRRARPTACRSTSRGNRTSGAVIRRDVTASTATAQSMAASVANATAAVPVPSSAQDLLRRCTASTRKWTC